MLNIMTTHYKSKILSSFMSNEKTRKMIKDALNSSPGNIKRKKVASMIKVAGKNAGVTEDGVGGYTPGIIPTFGSALSSAGSYLGNKVSENVGKVGSAYSYNLNLLKNTPAYLFGGNTSSPSSVNQPTSGNGKKLILSSAPARANIANAQTIENGQQSSSLNYTPMNFTPNNQSSGINSYNLAYPQTKEINKSLPTLNGETFDQYLQRLQNQNRISYIPEKVNELKQDFYFQASKQNNNGNVPGSGITGSSPSLPSSTEEPVAYYDTWYNNLTPEQQKENKILYEALKAGIGSSSYAWQQMDALNPKNGASLVRQEADLKDALKKEYNIDQLYNNLQAKKNQGMTIESDLTDYITARDKYIEKIDGMIDTTLNKIANSSMIGDPNYQKRMNNYTNYLYLMKGKQQKRYTDFLKSGINQYNSELTRLSDEYNTAYKNFTDEFNTSKAITEEDYNRQYQMLQDMYNNVENRQKSIYNMGILDEQYKQEQVKTLKGLNDLKSNSNGIKLSPTQTNKLSSLLLDDGTKLTDNLSVDNQNSLYQWSGGDLNTMKQFIDDYEGELNDAPWTDINDYFNTWITDYSGGI